MRSFISPISTPILKDKKYRLSAINNNSKIEREVVEEEEEEEEDSSSSIRNKSIFINFDLLNLKTPIKENRENTSSIDKENLSSINNINNNTSTINSSNNNNTSKSKLKNTKEVMGITVSSPKTKEIIKSIDNYTSNSSIYRAFNLSTCVDETPIKSNRIKRNVTPFNKIYTPEILTPNTSSPCLSTSNTFKASTPSSMCEKSLFMDTLSPEPGFDVSANESPIPGTYSTNRRSTISPLLSTPLLSNQLISSTPLRRLTIMNTPSRASPLLSPPLTFYPTISPAKDKNLPSIESIQDILSTLSNDWNDRSANLSYIYHHALLSHNIEALVNVMKISLTDGRSSIIVDTCNMISACVRINPTEENIMIPLLPELMKVCSMTKLVMSSSGRFSLLAISATLGTSGVATLLELADSKKKMPPASLCSLLDAIFIYTMCNPDEVSARMVSNLVQSTIGDAKVNVRTSSRRLFFLFHYAFPEYALEIYDKLESRLQKALESLGFSSPSIKKEVAVEVNLEKLPANLSCRLAKNKEVLPPFAQIEACTFAGLMSVANAMIFEVNNRLFEYAKDGFFPLKIIVSEISKFVEVKFVEEVSESVASFENVKSVEVEEIVHDALIVEDGQVNELILDSSIIDAMTESKFSPINNESHFAYKFLPISPCLLEIPVSLMDSPLMDRNYVLSPMHMDLETDQVTCLSPLKFESLQSDEVCSSEYEVDKISLISKIYSAEDVTELSAKDNEIDIAISNSSLEKYDDSPAYDFKALITSAIISPFKISSTSEVCKIDTHKCDLIDVIYETQQELDKNSFQANKDTVDLINVTQQELEKDSVQIDIDTSNIEIQIQLVNVDVNSTPRKSVDEHVSFYEELTASSLKSSANYQSIALNKKTDRLESFAECDAVVPEIVPTSLFVELAMETQESSFTVDIEQKTHIFEDYMLSEEPIIVTTVLSSELLPETIVPSNNFVVPLSSKICADDCDDSFFLTIETCQKNFTLANKFALSTSDSVCTEEAISHSISPFLNVFETECQNMKESSDSEMYADEAVVLIPSLIDSKFTDAEFSEISAIKECPLDFLSEIEALKENCLNFLNSNEVAIENKVKHENVEVNNSPVEIFVNAIEKEKVHEELFINEVKELNEILPVVSFDIEDVAPLSQLIESQSLVQVKEPTVVSYSSFQPVVYAKVEAHQPIKNIKFTSSFKFYSVVAMVVLSLFAYIINSYVFPQNFVVVPAALLESSASYPNIEVIKKFDVENVEFAQPVISIIEPEVHQTQFIVDAPLVEMTADTEVFHAQVAETFEEVDKILAESVNIKLDIFENSGSSINTAEDISPLIKLNSFEEFIKVAEIASENFKYIELETPHINHVEEISVPEVIEISAEVLLTPTCPILETSSIYVVSLEKSGDQVEPTQFEHTLLTETDTTDELSPNIDNSHLEVIAESIIKINADVLVDSPLEDTLAVMEHFNTIETKPELNDLIAELNINPASVIIQNSLIEADANNSELLLVVDNNINGIETVVAEIVATSDVVLENALPEIVESSSTVIISESSSSFEFEELELIKDFNPVEVINLMQAEISIEKSADATEIAAILTETAAPLVEKEFDAAEKRYNSFFTLPNLFISLSCFSLIGAAMVLFQKMFSTPKILSSTSRKVLDQVLAKSLSIDTKVPSSEEFPVEEIKQLKKLSHTTPKATPKSVRTPKLSKSSTKLASVTPEQTQSISQSKFSKPFEFTYEPKPVLPVNSKIVKSLYEEQNIVHKPIVSKLKDEVFSPIRRSQRVR